MVTDLNLGIAGSRLRDQSAEGRLPSVEKKLGSYFWFGLFGALLSAVVVSWLAPRAITWYFKPPAPMDFSCEGPIAWALGRLRLAQIVGLGVGAVGGLLLCYAARRRQAPPPVHGTMVR